MGLFIIVEALYNVLTFSLLVALFRHVVSVVFQVLLFLLESTMDKKLFIQYTYDNIWNSKRVVGYRRNSLPVALGQSLQSEHS